MMNVHICSDIAPFTGSGFKSFDHTVMAFLESIPKALKRTGVDHFRFHDLRHTFVSNARKAGVDRTVIMKLAGHKTLSIFTLFNTVDQADAKDAMEKLESYFDKTEESTTAIVLQGLKRGQEKSPNPLNLLAPRVGFESRSKRD